MLGEFVQSENEPAKPNANAPHSLDFLCLRTAASTQKVFELLHIQTNKVATCLKIWSVPVTVSVINKVHALSRRDRMPNGLKITNITGQVLFDTSLTSGVGCA